MSQSEQPVQMFKSHYRVERLLGEGANGKTWLGVDIITGEKVAIKALKLSAVENLKSFELFEREAAVLASIQVEGVPKFYDSYVAKSSDEDSFIIQEYINAPAIEQYIKEKHYFTETETLCITEKIVQILNVLQTQYTPPIIHRDIKPSNIMCSTVMKNGKIDFENSDVYLIDFGAVANPQKNSGGSTVAGTFGYMAPEQYMGTVSPQSDFYSLGVTAIHMMTGCAPYDMTTDVFALQYKDKMKEICPNVSNAFIELIDSMIAPDASNRPATADKLLKAVQRVQRGLVPWPKEDIPNENAGKKQSKNVTNANALKERQTEKTTGTIRGIRQINNFNWCEYTFDVQGRTWCGLFMGLYSKSDKCIVQYQPDDPANNSLCAIKHI